MSINNPPFYILKWQDYIMNWDYYSGIGPTVVGTNISWTVNSNVYTGTVYQYYSTNFQNRGNASLYYRSVPTVYDTKGDVIWLNFNGSVLSNMLASRG